MSKKRLISGLIACITLAACASWVEEYLPLPLSTETEISISLQTETAAETETSIPETETPAPMPTMEATTTGTGIPATLTPTQTAKATALPEELALDPADWHNWPILPIVPERARLIYLYGQALGNDPHAFSIFGDCQSVPNVFMGVYETDAEIKSGLPLELQETVDWFSGSFARAAPTIKPGTTTASLLSPAWHKNAYSCTADETPIQCELRIHKPAFVLIHVGTHYESHNDYYMREILDQLMAAGVVPILVSKADNREVDEAINLEYAQLAVEYQIPFWNFWAALVSLEERGLYTRTEVAFEGPVYMTKQALTLHRLTALQTLDVVRRAVSAP